MQKHEKPTQKQNQPRVAKPSTATHVSRGSEWSNPMEQLILPPLASGKLQPCMAIQCPGRCSPRQLHRYMVAYHDRNVQDLGRQAQMLQYGYEHDI